MSEVSAPAAPVAAPAAPDAAQQPAAPAPAPAPSTSLGIQPPAPQAPVAPQEPPAPAPDPKGKAEPVEYEPTGDPGLDYALSFLGKAGYHDDHPAIQAASQGDFGLLKAELASKDIAGWEQALALAERAYETAQGEAAKVQEAVQESVTLVAESLGVDWEAAVEFARETATPEEIETINKMFSDPYTAKMAALWVSHAYSSNPNTSVPPAREPVKPNAIPAEGNTSQGTLTRAEFAAEAGKLHKRFGDSYTTSPEYKALARRLQR